jgi:hypothetical protein
MATTFTPRTQELWRLVLLEIDASNNKPDEDDVSPFRKASFQRQRMPQVDMAHARRVPIAGDFDGDGIDELGFFSDGDWFIDLNHNDRPDRNDLWIRLGKVGSTPLTGDWDGDGKCDVGVFDGQERSQDSSPEDSATEMETKNRDDLAEVAKTSPIGAARLKIEAIDRVFQFGKAGQQPVAGDWNGNGTTTIGVFTDGVWQLDLDGSGHWSSSDKQATFGAAGDVAYVGDFNGDGLADLAVLRDGVLIIDSNGNHELDSSDQRISAGSAEGAVVIGDFNGDGRDEVRVAESHGMRQAG